MRALRRGGTTGSRARASRARTRRSPRRSRPSCAAPSSRPPICAGVASPSMIAPIAAPPRPRTVPGAAARRSRPEAHQARSPLGAQRQEVREEALALGSGSTRDGTARPRRRAPVAHPHDLRPRVQRRRSRARRAALSRLDDQRVVAGARRTGCGSPRRRRAPSWRIARRLAVHEHRRPHDRARRRPAPMRLVAEADAEDRNLAARARGSASSEMPASSGVHGPGEITMRVGRSAATSSTVDRVVAHDARRRRRARPGTARGCR